MQRALLRDGAEREPLSKESVFLPLRLRLCAGSVTPLRSSDVHRRLQPPHLASPRTAELSGPCAPLREATLGGRGWSAQLLLFVAKLLEWVRQRVGYSCVSPGAQLSRGEPSLPSPWFFTCQRAQVINPKETRSHGTSPTGICGHTHCSHPFPVCGVFFVFLRKDLTMYVSLASPECRSG